MDELKAIAESELELIEDLRNIIGVENTAALIKCFGGTQMYIPQMNTVVKNIRDKAIYSDFESGLSFREIAINYSLSEMTVRDLVGKERRSKRERTKKLCSGAGGTDNG